MTFIVKITTVDDPRNWAVNKIGELFHAHLWKHFNKHENRKGKKIFVGTLPEYRWLPEECCELMPRIL